MKRTYPGRCKSLTLVTLALACSLLGWAMLPGVWAADDSAAQVQAVEPDMHEFMEYVVQPTYQRLQTSMAQLTAENANWGAIKSYSLILAEAANLVLGRGESTDASWQNHAQQTRQAGAALYSAAKAKDVQQVRSNYTMMIARCNACHQDFADGEHQLEP